MKKRIGKRIQMIRLVNNITQEQMADFLCISTSAYCKMEYGETDLTLTRIFRLAEIFKMQPLELVSCLLDSRSFDAKRDNDDVMNSTSVSGRMESALRDFVTLSRDVIDKMGGDLVRMENRLERIEDRLNQLEGFHLKD